MEDRPGPDTTAIRDVDCVDIAGSPLWSEDILEGLF
jgi:hypothetical protein